MDQVKIFGRQPLKNFTWSILEYLDPNIRPKHTKLLSLNDEESSENMLKQFFLSESEQNQNQNNKN